MYIIGCGGIRESSDLPPVYPLFAPCMVLEVSKQFECKGTKKKSYVQTYTEKI